MLESPSIDPSHFPPNHLCFQHQPSDKWSGKQTEISFNTEPQKLLGEDKNTLSINTNILLADGGDILNEAVSTAISIVKPRRILTNVLLLEQQILLAEIYISQYFPYICIWAFQTKGGSKPQILQKTDKNNQCYRFTNTTKRHK